MVDTLFPDRLQAASVAAVANTLLHPEAVQLLLAGHRANAAASEGPAALGNPQGVGTMQELLLSLRAAAASGGGDVQRMFGAPLLADEPALLTPHFAATLCQQSSAWCGAIHAWHGVHLSSVGMIPWWR